MLASELTLGHVGSTVRSVVYPNKNKTAKPKFSYKGRGPDGIAIYDTQPHEYYIESMYVHENGNIVINGGWEYLHMDTEVEIVSRA